MDDFLLTEDIGVYIINMDTKVQEQVVLNEDGSYTIFLNARISHGQRMTAYRHAIQHIMNDDFSKDVADEIEKAM